MIPIRGFRYKLTGAKSDDFAAKTFYGLGPLCEGAVERKRD